jgi:hypothetical protein
VVLGAPAVEDPTGVSHGHPARVARALLAAGLALLPGAARAAGEDPAAEVAAALQSLGPPGTLWGRFTVDEESPVGAWTPLAGVEVTLYPATPALVAELERIRQSARTSGARYESAVARVQAALAVHQARIDGQKPPPEPAMEDGPGTTPPVPAPAPAAPAPVPAARPARPGAGATTAGASETGSPAAPAPKHPWRQRTDPAGLFVYDAVPSGDWLVVATRVTAYGGQKLRAEPRPRSSASGQKFLPRATTPPKEAEVWVVRVRVGAAERVGLELSDRTRWLVGPVR